MRGMLRNSRPTFVLVHGAWHGGWCWRNVAALIEQAGATVFTPSLTGLGERAHLVNPIPTLNTYIDDIAGVIESEELGEVILVGHSYAGMVITGVADKLKSRLRSLVYLDAAVPLDGQDFAGAIPGIGSEEAERRRQAFRALAPDGVWIPPIAPELVGVSEPESRAWLARRLKPHPVQTWLEPIALPNGGHLGLPKTYVLATEPLTPQMGYSQHADEASKGGEWTCRQISTGHDMMITKPGETAALLLEAARGRGQ